MQDKRPIVMSIAGMDPSAGAGLLADIKTFEQHKVYGLGISTAQTLQTDNQFFSIRWEETDDILEAIEKMLSNYEVKAIKIGIVKNISAFADKFHR
jgi:hydroxymethylpyrimidine/phosphomethylpyrimidine kinase